MSKTKLREVEEKSLFLPSEYVFALKNLSVDGYTGSDFGSVAISSYCSAKYGSTSNTIMLKNALANYVPGLRGQFNVEDYDRVFSGQGKAEDFERVLVEINKIRDKLEKNPGFTKYFKEKNFLQAMLDDGCIGQDCIGFVGSFLDFAGLYKGYYGSAPIDYSSNFPLVSSLDDVKPLSVLIHCSGMHIQIVDSIKMVQDGVMHLTICQSSSGGPQVNTGVTLRRGTASVLDVDKFRGQKIARTSRTAYEAAYPPGTGGPNYHDFVNEAESALRKECMAPPSATGYHHGAIFSLSGGGSAVNPMPGNVYVGTLKGMHKAVYNPASGELE